MWDEAPAKDKTLVWLEETWHSMLVEPEIDYIIDYSVKWIL